MEKFFDQANDSNTCHPSDSDDLRLFESRDYPGLAIKIIRIKHNDPGVKSLSMYSVADLDERAWMRLGDILSQATNMKELIIFHGSPDVAGLCAGIRHGRCIQEFDLRGTDLRRAEGISSLAPFLSSNPSLRTVTLRDCNIGQIGVNIISNALSNRPDDTLENLNLSGNHLSDNDLNELVLALEGGRKLKSLWLGYNEIGLMGCTLLGRLLRNQDSNLESLHLRNNFIDDESVIILANSLADNTKLEQLALGGNDRINFAGWSAMLNRVYSSSSISDVMNSNHTLNDVGMRYYDKSLGIVERTLGTDNANLLRASLNENATSSKILVSRRKILWSHVRRNLNLGDSSIPNGAMPRVLAWFGDNSNETNANIIQYHDPPLTEARIDIIRLDSIYRIFRHVPDLCKVNGIGRCDDGQTGCLPPSMQHTGRQRTRRDPRQRRRSAKRKLDDAIS